MTKINNLKNENKPRVAVVAPTETEIPSMFAANFTRILECICEEICLIIITGNFLPRFTNKTHVIEIERRRSHYKTQPLWIQIIRFPLIQLRFSLNLIKISKNIDIVAFYVGGPMQAIPVLCSKLLRKRTVVFYFGSRRTYEKRYSETLFGLGGIVYSRLMWILQTVTLLLADQVAVESESVIEFAGLRRYKNKIAINGALYIDTHTFMEKRDLKNRRHLVGYIAALELKKGISEFAKALPIILKDRKDIESLIGGGGSLFDRIDKELRSSNSRDRVNLTGFIPHQKVHDYLNELKLLVLPSYTEGIPGIVQEAMACGTPVLATPVGGIPDLVKDGETGFIMENNSPECIAENVIRALEHPNLDEIVKNARKLIEDEYSYEVMVRKCRDSLNELMKGK